MSSSAASSASSPPVAPSCGFVKRVSRCTRARGRARRVAWLQFRSQQYDRNPADKIWLLYRLGILATKGEAAFPRYVRNYLSCTIAKGGRFRDIFPMMILQGSEFRPSDMPLFRWNLLRDYLNVVLGGLHFLSNSYLKVGLPRSLNASQKSVCERMVKRACEFLDRLNQADDVAVLAQLPSWSQFKTKRLHLHLDAISPAISPFLYRCLLGFLCTHCAVTTLSDLRQK